MDTAVQTQHCAPGSFSAKPARAASRSKSGVRTASISAPSIWKRAGDGVVLPAGDDGAPARAHEAPKRDIERVGGVHGEDDVLASGDAEEPRRAPRGIRTPSPRPGARACARRGPGSPCSAPAAAIAAGTARGFWSVVAALSRYITAPPPRNRAVGLRAVELAVGDAALREGRRGPR